MPLNLAVIYIDYSESKTQDRLNLLKKLRHPFHSIEFFKIQHNRHILKQINNVWLQAKKSDLILLVPSFIDPRQDFLLQLARPLNKNTADVVYSDFGWGKQNHGTQEILTSPEDFCEWTGWGYVVMFRSRLLGEGFLNPRLEIVWTYALRLKLGAAGNRWRRVPGPLYRFHIRKGSRLAKGWTTLFSEYFMPGGTTKPGYAYLFDSAARSRRVEKIFISELKKRKIYLNRRTKKVACPHAAASLVASIIIPTHNRAPLIGHAIDSVLSSNIENIEIIVVDNQSTDGTRAVVQRYAKQDPRVRYIKNRVNNISRAFNLGIQAAKGRFVGQLDSDDLYEPTTVEKMTKALLSHSAWGGAVSYYDLIDSDRSPRKDLGVIKHLEYDQNQILRTNGIGAVRFWHRCVLQEVGGFDSKFGEYGEDYDLVLRIGERYEIGRVHDVLYHVRLHAGNLEQRLSKSRKAELKLLVRKNAYARRRNLFRKT